jgi:hypothetical protein
MQVRHTLTPEDQLHPTSSAYAAAPTAFSIAIWSAGPDAANVANRDR